MAASLFAAVCLAERDHFVVGDGHGGPLTVQAPDTVVNAFAVLANARSTGDQSLPVIPANSEAAFAPGDLIMVLQTAGLTPVPDSGTPGPFDLSNAAVGTWELARVSNVSPGAINLTAPLEHSFAANATQVIKIPEYTDVTVSPGASLVAKPWDGSSGGVLAFFATGRLVNNGLISATALGFRPGIALNQPGQVKNCTAMDELPLDGGQKGEGVASSRFGPANNGRGNVANGAGGGDCHNSGGGGGGNGGMGGVGGKSWVGDLSRDVGGLGGGALIYSLVDHLTIGGGGGAGHENDRAGSSGGHGGGAIFIRAASMPTGGTIAADGESAPNATANDGAGGGGAGGSVYLRIAGPSACAAVSANGGNGGSLPDPRHGPGGGGGGGRILLQGSDTSACAVSVFSGIAGTQADPNAPGGLHYGAEPAAKDLPNFIGRVENPPGPYDGGGFDPNAPVRLAGSCGCRSGGGQAAVLLGALAAIAALSWNRRRKLPG